MGERESPFKPGDKVSTGKAYLGLSPYAPAIVEKIYKNGNIVMQGSRKQHRPYELEIWTEKHDEHNRRAAVLRQWRRSIDRLTDMRNKPDLPSEAALECMKALMCALFEDIAKQ